MNVSEWQKNMNEPKEQAVGHNKTKTGINTFLLHKQGLNGILRRATLNVFSGPNKVLEVI